jgi:hypothetical protein
MPHDVPTTLARFLDGDFTALQAQRHLLHLLSVERDYAADALAKAEQFKAIEKATRDALYTIAWNSGETADGVQLVQPSARRSYDAKALDTLVAELSVTNPDIAQRIAQCGETKTASGYVKVVAK